MDPFISGRQLKAARALLGWKRKTVAAQAGITVVTVRMVERDDSDMAALASIRARMQQVLTTAGIAFTTDGAPGVRLVPASESRRSPTLVASNDD